MICNPSNKYLQRNYCKITIISLQILVLFIILSCSDMQEKNALLPGYPNADINTWAYDGINELIKGDIIVKPNLNILPGTAYMPGGWGFGHAAIVTRGARNPHADSLLANSMIFESHAKDVPRIHQLREIQGYVLDENPYFHNDTFGPDFTGNRYRLRLNIPESQIDSIIDFVISQKGSYSSWNAMKRFPDMPEIQEMVDKGIRANWADNTHWYCSLIIWQAVLYVTGIDIDANGGYFVYPSDMVASPYFDNVQDFRSRVRF